MNALDLWTRRGREHLINTLALAYGAHSWISKTPMRIADYAIRGKLRSYWP